MVSYSAIVCLVLLVLGGHFLLYEEWELPPQPPLEQFWTGQDPFRIEPNQSVTATYTVTYNWTGTGTEEWMPNGTFLIIQDRRAPANTFEVRELDLGSYNTYVVTGNANYTVKVYSPSGELINEHINESDDSGINWFIQKPGTYRIVITNLNQTEPLEMKGTFQFTRNRFYKPYAWIGYVIFLLALGFPLVVLVGKLRGRGHTKDEAS